MTTQTITVINDGRIETIHLGIAGENQRRSIVFDLTALVEEYGEPSSVRLNVLKPHSEDVYGYDLTVTDNVATWVIQDDDLDSAGYGAAEIVYRASAGAVAKTEYRTVIDRSIID